ncbi:hypothetical protein NU09_3446 [Flavobacterium beibuense]|uniref:Uncharacterized protein n=1 Tax=Flavobacterium beibuense TaxID=657326 RepID=A0A444W3D4_9FLAO|nr:hypothetical protein NU09_3446 [Flavobacterium beibuense]
MRVVHKAYALYGNLITRKLRAHIPYIHRMGTCRYIGKHIAALPHAVLIQFVLILSIPFNKHSDNLVVAEVVGHLIANTNRAGRAALLYRKGCRDIRDTVQWCRACYLHRIVTLRTGLIGRRSRVIIGQFHTVKVPHKAVAHTTWDTAVQSYCP